MPILYIFLNKIRYSWILWKIFVNRNIICQITILANRNNVHEMKLWQMGIGIYLWPKYQRRDSWQIYSQTIHKLFANRELFAERWMTAQHSLSFCFLKTFSCYHEMCGYMSVAHTYYWLKLIFPHKVNYQVLVYTWSHLSQCILYPQKK